MRKTCRAWGRSDEKPERLVCCGYASFVKSCLLTQLVVEGRLGYLCLLTLIRPSGELGNCFLVL